MPPRRLGPGGPSSDILHVELRGWPERAWLGVSSVRRTRAAHRAGTTGHWFSGNGANGLADFPPHAPLPGYTAPPLSYLTRDEMLQV